MDVVEPETLTSAFRVKEKESGDVGKFLNRILGLDVDHQIMVCDLSLHQLFASVLLASLNVPG